jgi:Fe-coproporphyrin III synthase
MAQISVVIPSYNSADSIGATLDSLLRQSLAPFEIIVVNDGSTDRTAEAVRAFPTVRLVERTVQGGAGAARGDGVRSARGDIIAFIDSDCVAESDWIERIACAFDQDPALGAFGGCYVHRETPTLVALFGKFEEEFGHHIFAKTPRDSALTGGNMAVRKIIWENARSGRELIHFARVASTEDTAVVNEIRAMSATLFDLALIVYHRPKNDLRRFVRRNITRARTRVIGRLNGLVGSDNVFDFFGGWWLFCSTVALWTAPIPLALIPWLPQSAGLLLGTSLALAALHAVLAAPYFSFIAANRDKPYGRATSLAENLGIRALLCLRSALWVLGTLLGAASYFAERMGRMWDVALSMIHFWRPRRISKLFYFVTSKCNARCSFCFNLDNVVNWRERQKTELTLDEVRQMTTKFGRLPYLTLSGGEPFARIDLPEVISAFYTNAHTRWVTIPTNGALTKRVVEGVKAILVSCPRIFLTVQFSVDSLHEEHDKSRKIAGGFESLLETGRVLSGLRRYYPNLRLQINTPYDTFNLDRIDAVRTFIRGRIDFDQYFFYMLRDEKTLISDKNAHLADGFLEFIARNDAEELARTRPSLWSRAVRALQTVTYEDTRRIKKYKEFIRPCFATQKFVTLYDDGSFTPCEVLEDRPIANIRDFGFDFYRMKRETGVDTMHKKEIVDTKCNCEWMCAPPMNMLYDPKSWRRIARNFFRPSHGVRELMVARPTSAPPAE